MEMDKRTEGDEEERQAHFAVAADKKFALAGVDTVPGERVDFELLQSPVSGIIGYGIQRTICETKTRKKAVVSDDLPQRHPQHPGAIHPANAAKGRHSGFL